MNLPKQVTSAQLEEFRLQFEAGHADALMHALLFCAKHKLVMPDWVDWELQQAWNRFINREAADLGAAFGITWPKGQHKAAYLKKRLLKFAVYLRVCELHLNRPLDDRLFGDVGREFNIGKTLAKEYYYDAAKRTSLPIGVKLLLEPYRRRPGSTSNE